MFDIGSSVGGLPRMRSDDVSMRQLPPPPLVSPRGVVSYVLARARSLPNDIVVLNRAFVASKIERFVHAFGICVVRMVNQGLS